MRFVDLNADVGESFGRYRLGEDEALLQIVSSVNIACGFHAGDPEVMAHTLCLAKKHQVAVGAHPGFFDLAGFGRRRIPLTAREIYHLVVYQLGALLGFCKAYEVPLHHVKPHGALYNWAAEEKTIADAIAQGVVDVDPALILVGLSQSALIYAGKDKGLCVCEEVFADRAYTSSGSLVARDVEGAIIKDVKTALGRIHTMLDQGVVEAVDGSLVPVQSDTLCVHGDEPAAVFFAQALKEELQASGVVVQAFTREQTK